MKKLSQFSLPYLLIAIFIFFSAYGSLTDSASPERQWSQYRGNKSSGILDQANLPEVWNIATGENILWNIQVPGLGLSSPVIWDDKLFITTAISSDDKEGLMDGIYGDIGSVNDESEHEWKIYCLDKNTGETIWEKVACTGIPRQKRHPKSTHANCSAATNGNYVVAFFGSEGLYCYDMDGTLQWMKDFGVLRSVFFSVESAEWEFASSPIIHEDKVIVQCDVMENSFLAAFDVKSGNELWKSVRDEYPGWCTPNVYLVGGRQIIAVNGFKHRGGYDLETGEEIWKMSGGGDIQIPTPIIGHDLIYFNSAHGPQSPIMAISTSAKGDITLQRGQTSNEFVKWSIPRGGSYIQTMILYDGLLYNLNWNGQLDCFNAENGEKVYSEKIGRADSFTASPVASDGRIIVVSDKGEVSFIQAGKEFKIISQNQLDDICMVTPAITNGIIFFRTQGRLMAVSEK